MTLHKEQYEKWFNEPENSTKWKAALYGISVPAWYYLCVETHILEFMAQAGLLDGPGWFQRLSRIYHEARQIDNYSHKIEGKGWIN